MLGIAIGLGMDAFAVSIATGVVLPRITFRHVFRLSFHFGLFQFMMPIIGWWAGSAIAARIEAVDHWIAFGLLAAVGGKMIKDSLSGQSSDQSRKDPTRRMSLVILSIATSIDALAIGLSLAMLRAEIIYPSIVIGFTAAAMTIVGITAGSKLGRRLGKRMELLGGLLLIAIGLRILISHLAG
jgi:putative Mn2+ efflux pump MntP